MQITITRTDEGVAEARGRVCGYTLVAMLENPAESLQISVSVLDQSTTGETESLARARAADMARELLAELRARDIAYRRDRDKS